MLAMESLRLVRGLVVFARHPGKKVHMQCSSLLNSLVALSVMLLSSGVFSQGTIDAYPSKPVLVIVPYVPGGAAGNEARLEATKMGSLMGQPFLVDFKPGAGTTVGTAFVAKAAPDGYTLLAVPSGFTIFPALYKDLPFDVLKDFSPISLMTKKHMAMLVHPSFPAKTFSEYISHARANPGKINFGTSGAGDIIHLAGAWVHSATNTKVTFVHYKGAAPRNLDLLAGRVDVAVLSLLSAVPLLKAGRLRFMGITNDTRSPLLPDMPTIAEQGIPGFNAVLWQGFSAPGATPTAIVNKLGDGFARVTKAPEVAGPLEAEGSVMVGSTPAQFRQIIIEETVRWRKLVQENDIKLDE